MDKNHNNRIPDWLLSHLPYNHYNIKVGTKSMHVMEKGNGRPIVLVHGNPMWGYLYKKVLDQLDNVSARLIVPDLIGFVFSDKINYYIVQARHNPLSYGAMYIRINETFLCMCILVIVVIFLFERYTLGLIQKGSLYYVA